jgi:hypothetical protein
MRHRAVTVSLAVEEFALLQELNSRLRRLDVEANNSTPFRTGIRLLAAMDDQELEGVVRSTPRIPRGPQPVEGKDRAAK